MKNIKKYILDIYSYGKDILKQIAQKGFFHLLTANILIQIFGYGSQFFVAWVLTPEQIGQVRVMQTYLNLFTIFASLGFNTSILKLCSERRPIGEIIFLYKKAFTYTLIALCIIFSIIILLSNLNLLSNDENVNKYLPFYSLALIPVTLNSMDFSYLQARKKIKEIANVQSLTKLISLFLVIGITSLLGFNGYIIAIVIGYTLTFILFFNKANYLNKGIQIVPLSNPFNTHWTYAKFSFLANILGQIGSYSDILLMNYFIYDKEMLGYYSFALTMTMVVRMFTSTVQQIISPYFSEKANNITELKKAYKKYNKLYIASSSTIIFILFIIFPFIIDLIFSNKYHNSIPFFKLLLIATFIQNIYTIKGYILFGIGKIDLNFYSSIITTLFNLFIVYVMLINYDILGVAYGMIISNIFSFFIMYIFYNKGIKDYEKNKNYT